MALQQPHRQSGARASSFGWTAWGDEAADEVVPRGVVHKGYEGGAILPPLMPNEHLSKDRINAMGDKLRALYQSGHSVRQLAENTGYSIQRIRTLLQAAETSMRPRGRTTAATADLFPAAE